MRVLLEKDKRTVDLEDDFYMTGFLELVIKALESLDYTKEDIVRYLDERDN